MSIHVPDRETGSSAPAGDEKVWIGLALLWCFVMSI